MARVAGKDENMENISVVNKSMELAEVKDSWFYDEKHGCWCLEDVLFTPRATVPKFQRLSVFVPKELLCADGTFHDKAKKVPVIFENNAAGYMQMPHVWLDGPRCYAKQYLEAGYVYVSCGCRGRESRNEKGELVGKAPASLVDLKTAIRFLRHNRECLPGDWDRIISVGWSAGGAMSALLGVTGDNERYRDYLEENGAFMEESDSVFAAQIYCPIIDLEHADMAYEWMFQADKTCENSAAGNAETMSAFKEALSDGLSKRYVEYWNSLRLRHPDTGELLVLGEDGRSGSAYEYLMEQLNASATKFLTWLQQNKLPQNYSVEDYLTGCYTYTGPAPKPPKPGSAAGEHHAGPGVCLPDLEAPLSLGDLVSRPPRGVQYVGRERPTMEYQGKAKPWLTWNGEKAAVRDLDGYVLSHRRRMKPCTSFDTLGMNSGENQVFGSMQEDYLHFNGEIAGVLETLREEFPSETAQYLPAFSAIQGDKALANRVYLTNPLNFIGNEERSVQAKHYRIRVGACDADTAFTVSMSLALKLANAGCGSVDYALVWDQPHAEADYPGEVLEWIRNICEEN